MTSVNCQNLRRNNQRKGKSKRCFLVDGCLWIRYYSCIVEESAKEVIPVKKAIADSRSHSSSIAFVYQ